MLYPFTFAPIPISFVKWKFHIRKYSNSVSISRVKLHVKLSQGLNSPGLKFGGDFRWTEIYQLINYGLDGANGYESGGTYM